MKEVYFIKKGNIEIISKIKKIHDEKEGSQNKYYKCEKYLKRKKLRISTKIENIKSNYHINEEKRLFCLNEN